MLINEKWNIVYYRSASGEYPVYDFINKLEAKSKSKIINTIDLLETYGIKLGASHAKKVAGTSLWELRILGGDNIRVLYVAITGRAFLLLHGFIKKVQKTPKKEIKTAVMRLKNYKQREA
jgi:phage-related protein